MILKNKINGKTEWLIKEERWVFTVGRACGGTRIARPAGSSSPAERCRGGSRLAPRGTAHIPRTGRGRPEGRNQRAAASWGKKVGRRRGFSFLSPWSRPLRAGRLRRPEMIKNSKKNCCRWCTYGELRRGRGRAWGSSGGDGGGGSNPWKLDGCWSVSGCVAESKMWSWGLKRVE